MRGKPIQTGCGRTAGKHGLCRRLGSYSRQIHEFGQIFGFAAAARSTTMVHRRLAATRAAGRYPMSSRSMPRIAGLFLGILMTTSFASADALKDEIVPTGKLRVAIAISPAGGAFWSTKTENGYAGVPVDLGKEMAAQLGVPVEYVAHNNSGQIVDATGKGTWDVTFLPKDPEREGRMSFGPIYEVADATYIVKAGSTIKDFATLD